MKAAAVIVDYKTPELLLKAIDTADKALRPDEQIFVVDCSEDMELATVKPPTGCREVLIDYPGNVGYAAALNIGIARLKFDSNPDLLILSNADIEYPDWEGLEVLRGVMDAWPLCSVLGPRQVTPNGYIAHAGIPRLGDTTGGRFYGEPADGQALETFLSVPQISGSVMMLRKAALKDIGGNIPAPGLMYYEDASLCRDLRAKGWQVGYSGAATFVHHVGASPCPPGENRAAMAAESRKAFLA
jgi:GT2 family glycosyltransferase